MTSDLQTRVADGRSDSLISRRKLTVSFHWYLLQNVNVQLKRLKNVFEIVRREELRCWGRWQSWRVPTSNED